MWTISRPPGLAPCYASSGSRRGCRRSRLRSVTPAPLPYLVTTDPDPAPSRDPASLTRRELERPGSRHDQDQHLVTRDEFGCSSATCSSAVTAAATGGADSTD